MAPVTIAGALVLQNAEALAAIAFSQVVRPGAPVVYGGFTSNVDMKSGAPAFGTPEYVKAQLIGGQLARRYRPSLPELERLQRRTPSMPRPPTRACSRCGGRSTAG